MQLLSVVLSRGSQFTTNRRMSIGGDFTCQRITNHRLYEHKRMVETEVSFLWLFPSITNSGKKINFLPLLRGSGLFVQRLNILTRNAQCANTKSCRNKWSRTILGKHLDWNYWRSFNWAAIKTSHKYRSFLEDLPILLYKYPF